MADDIVDAGARTLRPPERARRLAALIDAESLAGERLGRLTDPVANAMLEAGLYSMLLPARLGGDAATRVEFFETVEAVARADGSAGWCLSVCSSIADFLCRGASPEAVDEVLGQGPVALWTSLLPRASAASAPGGWRVSGAFAMGSGSAAASWVLIPSPIEDRDGAQWFRAYILPKADVTLKPDTWDVMGLRATSSVEYTIDGAFAPAHRTFEYPYLEPQRAGTVSTLYGVRLNQIGLAAFACGVARRALDELLDAAPKTRRTVGAGTLADDHVVQFGVGELEGRLAAARSHLLSLIGANDEHMAAHGFSDSALAGLILRAAQILTRASRELTVFAFDYAGAGVIFAASPVQRCLRDLFTGLKHASFTPALLTELGQARLNRRSARKRLS